MALERRVVRLGRGEAVFHFLRGRNRRAAVGIKGNGILIDVPLRCQGDVACDRSIKVIRGGVLLVIAQIPEGKGMALERRLGRQDSLLAALDVLLIGRRETAVSVEGNGIFLRHMYAALRLELPAVPGPDQRDRNDLLIVLDMFQGRERLVELGHIEVGVIADVAKPVVPVLPQLADEVVCIALAEQIVGVLMLLRIIYDALDLNSHFKLFQLVSRRGFGRGLGLAAFDFNVSINAVRAANQVPRAILPPPFDVGFLVWLRIGVGFVDILIEPRNVLRFVQFDGIDVCSIDIIRAAVCVCTGQDAIVLRVRIMLGRPLDALHTNFGLLFFKVRLRVAGLVRGHFMRGFDPRVRCRFHPRLTIFIIGEVERDGRRGLGVLYLPDLIAGLLHEPCRPDSHWADISARAIAYDLADRMLCVGRVSERILYHNMRSGCRNADNIYNNAGHVVFRGLGGLVDGRGLRLPDGVEIGGRGGCCNLIARLDGGLCCARISSPAEEGIAVAGRRLRGNGESMGLLILRGRLVGLAGRCAGAAVGIIVQRESQQNGRAFEIVICGVLAVGKQGACVLAASVAAASGPTDVVDLVIVNTLPDILCIGKTEGFVVDVVRAEVNGDVIVADA